jgi:hypothetical protein
VPIPYPDYSLYPSLEDLPDFVPFSGGGAEPLSDFGLYPSGGLYPSLSLYPGQVFGLTETVDRLLEDLPEFERESVDIVGTLDALAQELDRVDARMSQELLDIVPTTAVDLRAHESLLRLSVNPPDKTLDQRRDSVLAFYRSLANAGSAQAWVDALTALLGQSWTWREYDSRDPSSPPEYSVRLTIPFGGALLSPSGLAATPSTTGGTLTAGTRWYVVTALNVLGETTGSTAVSAVTTGTTGSVALSWSAVANATGYRIYRGPSASVVTLMGSATTNAYTDTGASAPGITP